jgi:HK97 family phage portal protein
MPRLRDALGWLAPARARPMTGVLPAPDAQASSAAPDAKASATARVLAWETLGQPVWSPRDYHAFASEGFMQNPIVYRSVRMIAEAAATIPLLLYERGYEHEQHPLLDLLARPSLDHTGTDLLESWYGFLLVSGNAYAEAVAVGGEIREIHALRPDRMKVIPGPDGWPEGYEYAAAGRSVRLAGEIDGVRGSVRRVLHVRLFHPTNDHYGMSPIEAAAFAIDTHNTAAGWNKALLDNAARPSGALVYAARDGNLTDEQFARLKAELEAGFQGARNAGRPLLLEGGLDWKPLSLTPKDMDFVEAKNAAAREIALALGVPPMLLGIPGDNTYSNYQEATRSFWRQTVLPLVNRTAKALSGWLGPAWGGGLDLRPDLDQIEALSSEREALWARVGKAEFLSEDEKRALVGYGPMPAGPAPGDGGAKFNPYHDDRGRFTTVEGAGGGDDPFADTLPEIVVG